MYVPLHLEWLVLSTCFQFLLCTRVGDRLCSLINCSRLGKEEKHMVAVHDYRKPLVGHHSPIMYKVGHHSPIMYKQTKKSPSHSISGDSISWDSISATVGASHSRQALIDWLRISG